MNNLTLAMQLNNRGKLAGKINDEEINKFEVEGEIFYEGKIRVNRLSETIDILPFTISEKTLKTHNLILKKDLEVCFEGELRSYNRVIDGKSRLILSFFVKDVLSFDIENDGINELCLTGYICKEPIYRTTPFNRQICDILVAVNRPNFNKSDYIPCILWGRNAKLMQTQKVGTKIYLYGRIQSRTYKKEVSEGVFENRVAYEVSCQKLNIEDSDKIANTEDIGA